MPLSFVISKNGLTVHDGRELLATIPKGVPTASIRRHVRHEADAVRVTVAVDKLRRYLDKATGSDGVIRRTD